MNLVRALLSSQCKLLYDRIIDYLSCKSDTYLYSQYFEAAIDLIKFKIGNPQFKDKAKKERPSNSCHIHFDNKALDFINPHRILRDKNVRQALPTNLRMNHPSIVYSLANPIRSRLFNYKDFVQNLNIEEFVSDNTSLPCHCEESPFADGHHHHVIIDDL